MVLIVAVVLLMYFRTPGTAGTSHAVQCTEQKGIALKWMKPFALCGNVYGVAEGENSSILEMHFPLCLEGNCLIACASATVSHVNITFEWCAHRTVPALLLPNRIHRLDLTVDWDNESVTFYGYSKGYRVVFEIGRNVSCIEAACRQIILYASEKSKLPEPYSFHPAYSSGGQTREKLPFNLHGNKNISCFRQKGIALRWVHPFSIRGELIGMVEGLSASATNYYTVSLHNQCIVIMFDIDRQYVNLVLEQWDSFDANLMLADHINETDFTIEQRGRSILKTAEK
uniref:Uncharacterized protein n=1 Tax=Anopheles melas TaxID=34690 RepID=A0A182TP73_9DIPT